MQRQFISAVQSSLFNQSIHQSIQSNPYPYLPKKIICGISKVCTKPKISEVLSLFFSLFSLFNYFQNFLVNFFFQKKEFFLAFCKWSSANKTQFNTTKSKSKPKSINNQSTIDNRQDQTKVFFSNQPNKICRCP